LFDLIQQRIADFFSASGRGWTIVADILLVTLLNYYLLKLVRGTRAWKILIGMGVFVLALYLSDVLGLQTLHYILQKASILAPVALVILLLPEMRRFIQDFAKLGLWPEKFLSSEAGPGDMIIESLGEAVQEMADQSIGALIAVEREERLDTVARSGVQLNAKVTAELVGAIFYHGNPLHDGAAIVRVDTVAAAACRLPLSENTAIDSHYHMRHRAGIGLSEQFDCIVIIVSEERGEISIAVGGELLVQSGREELCQSLTRLLSKTTGFGARKKSRRRKASGDDTPEEDNAPEEKAS
jgi:diadenylate cyclase